MYFLSTEARSLRFVHALLFFIIFSFCKSAFAAKTTSSDLSAVTQAVEAMCSKRVVLLGEASHGDGHSDSVKSALIKGLVTHCGFNAVLFEASAYEFTPILRAQRVGSTISENQIADAVGGMWKFDAEVKPLFTFLAHKVNDHVLVVGGIDFQPGGFQQPYSNELMIRELTSKIDDSNRSFCQSVFSALVLGNTPPQGISRKELPSQLIKCAGDIRNSIGSSLDSDTKNELQNLEAWLAAITSDPSLFTRSRDAMMVQNTLNVIDRMGEKSKVVIWTHNVHAARTSIMFQDYLGGNTLGSALAHRYGMQVFSLGITSREGTFRWSRTETRSLVPAPRGAVEALKSVPVMQGRSSFVDHHSLQSMGAAPAAFVSHIYKTADWYKAYDGVLVLDFEYPPHSSTR